MILFLLIVTATIRPATPAVGDLITLEFEQPVVLETSAAYEVVSHDGKRVVIRTFRPEAFEMSGRTGNVVFRKLVIPVRTVLEPNDTLQPAPLKPPLQPVPSRRPLAAMAIAAAVAALAWMASAALARRRGRPATVVPQIPAAERFRMTVANLRSDRARNDRWAALADAVRDYLVAIEPTIGAEMTTAELLRAVGDTNIRPQDVIVTILRQGDLQKFSPWGARAADFDAVAARALELIPRPEAEVAA